VGKREKKKMKKKKGKEGNIKRNSREKHTISGKAVNPRL
jgi:hypothetical protein